MSTNKQSKSCNLPTRKHNRLTDYDYSQDGVYFVTICTKNKAHILSRIEVLSTVSRRGGYHPPAAAQPPLKSGIKLTHIGKIADKAISSISSAYKSIFVDNYVIMPNHIHLLLRIKNAGGRMVSAPTAVASLKRYITKQAGIPVWQKGFYDHIVRDDYDYQIRWQYIDENPLKWADDEYFNA